MGIPSPMGPQLQDLHSYECPTKGIVKFFMMSAENTSVESVSLLSKFLHSCLPLSLPFQIFR